MAFEIMLEQSRPKKAKKTMAINLRSPVWIARVRHAAVSSAQLAALAEILPVENSNATANRGL